MTISLHSRPLPLCISSQAFSGRHRLDTSVGWDSIHQALFLPLCLRPALEKELADLKASYFSGLQGTGPLLLTKTLESEGVLSRPWVPVLNQTEELKALASELMN